MPGPATDGVQRIQAADRAIVLLKAGIITCALTGSGHTPSMSPSLPYTVSDLVDQGVAAAETCDGSRHSLYRAKPRRTYSPWPRKKWRGSSAVQ